MFARTKRLMLRPGWREDAPALARAIAHESVALRLAQMPWPYGLRDAETFVTRDRGVIDPTFLIFVHEESVVRLIGGIGIALDTGDAPELGYWLTPDAWGRGYATEAGRAVVAMARETLRLPRLAAGHFVDNPRSGKVLRKLGFVPTGRTEQRMCRARGVRVPCATYALELADDDCGPARMAA